MNVGKSGQAMPESQQDYDVLAAEEPTRLRYRGCLVCGKGFSGANVRTRLGWRETQLTGFCETCFDRIVKGGEA